LPNKLKASDKILLTKFNREFDEIVASMAEPIEAATKKNNSNEPSVEEQQFSPSPDRK
jgi:hypothetical protein